jgi:hypothetical protein
MVLITAGAGLREVLERAGVAPGVPACPVLDHRTERDDQSSRTRVRHGSVARSAA